MSTAAAAAGAAGAAATGAGALPTLTALDEELDRMIAGLDAEAFEKATRTIKKRFSEQVHLDDVPELRAEFRKKLASIELQLSGMVQVKLDGVKRAMDVIKAANEQMAAVRGEFEGMHELCRRAGDQGKLLFDAYPRLKMVNRARRNLERTLKEVTYFSNLPARVDHLVRLLETQPLQLRQVYLEGQQLELWRDELLRELKAQQSRQSPGPKGGKAGAGAVVSVSERMQATFGVHLEEVKKLLDALRKRIFSNVADCFQIVQVDPRILVLTLEIVDMHEAFQKQKAEQARERAQKNAENVEEAVALSLIEDLRTDVVTKLKQKIDERAISIFAQASSASAPNPAAGPDDEKPQTPFSAMLQAATRILLDLTYLRADVAPCFPASYNIMETFRSQYERHLVQNIGRLYQTQRGFPGLDQGELLQLMEWLDYYNQEIVNLGAAQPCPEFVQALSVCLQEYLVRVRTQMTEWFANILSREQEVATNAAGQPITSAPEDFFNIIHLQVLVALVKLSADNMCAVIVVCLNVIKTVLEETLAGLRARKVKAIKGGGDAAPGGNNNNNKAGDGAGAGALTLESLCATVNDYDRLQEKIQEFREELGRMGKLQEEHLAMVDAAVDQVLDGFVAIADEANAGCAQLVLRDLREAFNEELFSADWEEANDVVMQRVTMTFQDYYGDLAAWLPPFYFAKLVRECLEKAVALYLFALLRRGLRRDAKGKEPKPFRDPLVIAQKVRNDRTALGEFFGEYEEELKQAGLREAGALELQLLVLDHVVDLFEGGVTVESEATAPLLREFGPWGVDALAMIAFLRGEKDKPRAELKESLARYFDRFIKPGLLATAAAGGAGAGAGAGAGGDGKAAAVPSQPQGAGPGAQGQPQSQQQQQEGAAGAVVRASARFVHSPFDTEVDIDTLISGMKRVRAKK